MTPPFLSITPNNRWNSQLSNCDDDKVKASMDVHWPFVSAHTSVQCSWGNVWRLDDARWLTDLSWQDVVRSQFAYRKHHSTKTALLYIHDHLINAIGSQKISCFCLLDHSVAFGTIDHNILITRLSSWSVLEWFKSYLSDRCFHVKCVFCENSFSTSHTCSCGVPQILFFCTLVFVLYTTKLNTLISSLSLNHHLCADDTQLFFYPSDLESSITHLQNALQQISSCMTANLFTLNSSKTNFS